MKEGCLCIQNDLITGQKTALFSLLHNLILPFIDAACFTCTTLLNVRTQNIYLTLNTILF